MARDVRSSALLFPPNAANRAVCSTAMAQGIPPPKRNIEDDASETSDIPDDELSSPSVFSAESEVDVWNRNHYASFSPPMHQDPNGIFEAMQHEMATNVETGQQYSTSAPSQLYPSFDIGQFSSELTPHPQNTWLNDPLTELDLESWNNIMQGTFPPEYAGYVDLTAHAQSLPGHHTHYSQERFLQAVSPASSSETQPLIIPHPVQRGFELGSMNEEGIAAASTAPLRKTVKVRGRSNSNELGSTRRGPGRKGPLSKKTRKEAKDVREVGACESCKKRKAKVSNLHKLSSA